MCCHSNHPEHSMWQCHNHFSHNPLLWSKRKRKEMLEHYKECLQKQLDDTEEAIKEMEEEEK